MKILIKLLKSTPNFNLKLITGWAVELPNNLTGNAYLHFLENDLTDLLEEVPLHDRMNIWFMQDGAPPHYSMAVRQWLQENYPRRWIGRGNEAPQFWPPRSPDLNPLDFYLWGTLKEKVYSSPVLNIDDLRERVTNNMNVIKGAVETLERMRFNFLRRVRACIEANGGHFQQYLH